MLFLKRMANGDVLTPMAGQADAVLFLNASGQWAYKDQSGTVTVMTSGGGGSPGAPGVGITNIAKISGTGAPGTTDTYRITLSDSSYYGFTVYNGADGEDGAPGSGGGGGASVPTVIPKTGAHTLITTDLNNIIAVNSASNVNLTIPTDATLGSLGATVGASVEILQIGAGRVDIVAGSGVTLLKWSGYPSPSQNVSQSIVHVAANTWLVR